MVLDLSKPAVAPPPAKTRTPKATPEKTARASLVREEAVGGIFQIAAAGLLMAGQLPDAGAISAHGPEISRQTALLAESNEGVAKVVDYITAVGPYAGLLAAVMPLILQILVNHKRIPPGIMGTVSPEMLTAKIEREQAAAMAEFMAETAAMAEIMAETP